MPEGDTIHHAAMWIRSVLATRVPEEILTPQPRHRHDRWPERLAGRRVDAVDVQGKHLLLRFEGGLTLHSHLRMTGSWGVYGSGAPWRRSRRRAWLVIRAEGCEVVEFDGPVLELLPDARTRRDPRLARLGPDVLGERFDEDLFLRNLRAEDPRRPIGDSLLNQRILAGIGNMWKAEACFGASVDPWRPTGEVADEEALRIVTFARDRMSQSARDGFEARPRSVYRRGGEPCPRCGAAIRQRGQWEDNRLTFWCPGCQR
ncbi:MAG TPA: DNA-formamidopyrimidine glycosylase family protein [Solirubrobacteraceae bacterium]|nr:DNA-formamidopyrimidine glycosylase family protein [Solirubrobacteraceae bacterium]